MYEDDVTLDIDGYVENFEMKAIRAYHALLRQPEVEDVRVAISCSGEGLHLTAIYAEEVDDETRFRIRRNLGDDPSRTLLDEQRGAVGLTTGVMWSSKGKTPGERQTGYADVYDALEQIAMTGESAHERAKALQNEGHKGLSAFAGPSRYSVVE